MTEDLLELGDCVRVGPENLRDLYRLDSALGDAALDTRSVGGWPLLTRCSQCGRYQVKLCDPSAIRAWRRFPRCYDCRAA